MNLKEHLYQLPRHSRLYHVYHCDHVLGSFNDSGQGDRRFDPIKDASGQFIPSFYAAEHYIDAIAETLMRKDSQDKRIFKVDLNKQGLLQIDTSKRMTLIDVSSISYFDTLLNTDEAAYGRLQLFAATVAAQSNKYHGLTWFGRQRAIKGHRCMMFFGDRLTSQNFIKRVNEPLISNTAMQKLKDAAVALDCGLFA
ncbi:MAG: RES domain-containing protein [Algicola sp.]|nr:RES domain-containing protein [Algicola sp.]